MVTGPEMVTMLRKSVLGFVTVFALLTIHLSALAAPDQSGIRILHHEPLHSAVLPANRATKQALSGTGSSMSFEAFGRQFEVELENNVRLLDSLRSKGQVSSAATLYQGRITGNEESWARITTIDNRIYGMIFDGEELYGIEPNRDISGLTLTTPEGTDGESSIYRLSDTIAEAGAAACGVTQQVGTQNGASAYQALLGELSEMREVALAEGATLQIDVGLVADFEFFVDKGQDSVSELLARINNVDGIFSEQLGVQINASEVTVFDQAADPFTTTNPENLLDELSAFRSGNMPDPGLVHLFTGRDLDGSTIGVAFVNALCSIQGGVGVSEGNGSATFDSLIAAHELGHNFGAGHDGDAPCQGTASDFLMAAAINGSSTFSQCSLDSMATPVAQASCISPLIIADANVLLGFSTLNTHFDIAFDYDLTVSSVGMDEMQNVVADITLPTGFSIQSSTAESGSCTSGGGQASCALGNIPGNASRAISLNLLASVVGTFNTSVVISADNDENAGNDSSSGTIVVDPAVDLALSLQASASVQQNQSTSLTATVTNQTAIAASEVAVLVTIPTGLTASAATPSAGTCNVLPDNVSCQPGELSANGTVSIEVTLEAAELGEVQLSATVVGEDLETNASDNSAETTLTVVEVASAGDGGGGGLNLLLMLCLLPGLMREQWRRRIPTTRAGGCGA